MGKRKKTSTLIIVMKLKLTQSVSTEKNMCIDKYFSVDSQICPTVPPLPQRCNAPGNLRPSFHW